MKKTEDLDQLTKELKTLSQEIFLLKKRYKKLEDGSYKEELKNEIRSKQFQALFYIEKIQNLYKQKKDKDAEY